MENVKFYQFLEKIIKREKLDIKILPNNKKITIKTIERLINALMDKYRNLFLVENSLYNAIFYLKQVKTDLYYKYEQKNMENLENEIYRVIYLNYDNVIKKDSITELIKYILINNSEILGNKVINKEFVKQLDDDTIYSLLYEAKQNTIINISETIVNNYFEEIIANLNESIEDIYKKNLESVNKCEIE